MVEQSGRIDDPIQDVDLGESDDEGSGEIAEDQQSVGSEPDEEAADETPLPAPPEPLAVTQFSSFAEAELHPDLLTAIGAVGWSAPTPVQSLCLPHTLRGRELAGFAQTGTGKTGVFLITVSDRLLKNPELRTHREQGISYPASLVLVPTRELAMQIHGDGEAILGRVGIKSLAVFGGVDYEKQARALQEGQVDVVIATPGRLKDYVQKKIVSLAKCSLFVCDEVDRMFDMGFIEDVEYFLEKLPETTQKLLFSATTNPEVKELAFEYLNHPEYISVNPETITPETIEQHAVIVEAKNKLKVMLGLLRDHRPECAIVFTNTKLTAEWLHFKLENNGIDCDLITGDLPQRKRINLINRIKQGKLRALIATDVASRGLHISRVTHVYNFDIPEEPANYVHRIGRTARAGAKGSSYTLVCEDYGENLAPVKDLLGPQIDLKSEWFPEAYLAIEDKAGNPYARKQVEVPSARRSGPMAHQDSGRRLDGRRFEGRRPEARPRLPGEHGGSVDAHQRQSGRGPRHGGEARGGREARHGRYAGDRYAHGQGQGQTAGSGRFSHSQQGGIGPRLPARASSSPIAVLIEMLKRIWILFFGRGHR